MNNFISLSSLALDLRRVALMYYRGSKGAGRRFLQEALERKKEIDTKSLKPYLVKYLSNLKNLESVKDPRDLAEDALLYSIIFQNASLKLKESLWQI